MAAVAGIGTSYNTEYLIGALHKTATNEAPFFAMIGGFNGIVSEKKKQFSWSTIDNDAPSQDASLEGGSASFSHRSRAEIYNVLEIHDEAFQLTWTQQAVTDQVGASTLSILGPQVVQDESSLQGELKLEKIASDIDYSFLNGTFVDDTDAATARKTRGVLTAATTNLQTASETAPYGTTLTSVTVEADDNLFTKTSHGLQVGDEVELTALTGGTGLATGTAYFVVTATADTFSVSATRGGSAINVTLDGSAITVIKRNPLTKQRFDKLLRTMRDNGAKLKEPVLLAPTFQKQRISDIFGFAPADRNVGGVNVKTIENDITGAKLGVVLIRNMPADRIAVVDVAVCKPHMLYIPPKQNRMGGHLIQTPVPHDKSADAWRYYCEVGLEYGPEWYHGQIDGLTTDEALG